MTLEQAQRLKPGDLVTHENHGGLIWLVLGGPVEGRGEFAVVRVTWMDKLALLRRGLDPEYWHEWFALVRYLHLADPDPYEGLTIGPDTDL